MKLNGKESLQRAAFLLMIDQLGRKGKNERKGVRKGKGKGKGSPISVSGQEGKRSPTASFFFSRSCLFGPSRTRPVVSFVPVISVLIRMRSAPLGEAIRSVTHLVPAWVTGPGARPAGPGATPPPPGPRPPPGASGSQKTFSAQPGSFSRGKSWLAPRGAARPTLR
jgi:hypothetical protein